MPIVTIYITYDLLFIGDRRSPLANRDPFSIVASYVANFTYEVHTNLKMLRARNSKMLYEPAYKKAVSLNIKYFEIPKLVFQMDHLIDKQGIKLPLAM